MENAKTVELQVLDKLETGVKNVCETTKEAANSGVPFGVFAATLIKAACTFIKDDYINNIDNPYCTKDEQ